MSPRRRRMALLPALFAILGLAGAAPVAATDPVTYTASFLCDRADVPQSTVEQYNHQPDLGRESCAVGQVIQFAPGTIQIQVIAEFPVTLATVLPPTVTGIAPLTFYPHDGTRPNPGECKSTQRYVACNFTMPANDVTFVFHTPPPPATVSTFGAPVDAVPTVNRAQAGRVIPFKFSVSDIDGPVMDLTDADVDVVPVLTGCESGVAVDAIESYATGAGLVNLGNGDYLFAYKTSNSWAGACGTLTVSTTAGGSQSASFSFK